MSAMLSDDQTYSRLFRPWDASESAKNLDSQEMKTQFSSKEESAPNLKPKRKLMESKRENRLRKIRGNYKKIPSNLDQDCTISTTTLDSEDQKPGSTKARSQPNTESPVVSLTECCDRLLQEPPQIQKKSKAPLSKTAKTPTENLYTVPPPSLHLPPPDLLQFPPEMYPGFMPDLLPPVELAHALGIQPTDPLLLESLAQGYAMELEYARIMHQENQNKLLNARKQRPKKYKCPHCQVGFSNNGQLKGHIRIHTGERPYKCDDKTCGKTFTRNEELTRHKRIHSGLRPYACQTCGKKFGRRDHLKKHTRTHQLQAERMMPVFLPLSAVPHMGAFPYLYGY